MGLACNDSDDMGTAQRAVLLSGCRQFLHDVLPGSGGMIETGIRGQGSVIRWRSGQTNRREGLGILLLNGPFQGIGADPHPLEGKARGTVWKIQRGQKEVLGPGSGLLVLQAIMLGTLTQGFQGAHIVDL